MLWYYIPTDTTARENDMTSVFRIEHESDINLDSNHFYGPFNGGYGGVDAYRDSANDDPSNHPTPSDDGIPYECLTTSLIYGCMTLEEIEIWFQDIDGRYAMEQMGYIIREYSADHEDLLIGGIQVAVPADAVEFVAAYNVTTFAPHCPILAKEAFYDNIARHEEEMEEYREETRAYQQAA